MIKRVVDKPKQKTVKKFPEFDNSKIYIYQHEGDNGFSKILRDRHNNFTVQALENSYTRCGYKSFTALCKMITNPIYILDTQQDLARFIMGCREFPTVQEIEETVNEPLADDEVSVEDVCHCKIYASTSGRHLLIHYSTYDKPKTICHQSGENGFTETTLVSEGTLIGEIKAQLKQREVYQFDTQEEFLRWALEQVTGKSVYIGDRVLETKTTPTLNHKALDVLIDFYVERNAEKKRGCSALPVRTEFNCSGVDCYSQGCQSLCKKVLKAKILEAV